MRDDLDTARGVIWWAVLPLLLLVVSGFAVAAPSDVVLRCGDAGVSHGDPASSCEASWDGVMIASLVATDVIYCDLSGVGPAAVVVSSIEWNWQCLADTGDGFGWEVWEDLEWSGGGGAGPDAGPDDDEWTLEDLDLSRFAGVFATFFTICGLFWGLGKGVGVLVGFLRRL